MAETSVRLPNFFVVGAPRCGTTSLHSYLRQHPDVYLPVRKELHYFSSDLLQANAAGPGDADALASICRNRTNYERHYTNAGPESAVGEVSPSYLFYSEVAARLREYRADCKIIAILRNPIDKAFSQYKHLVRLDLEHLPFSSALAAETERKARGWSDMWRYIESSRYSRGIRAYLEAFEADQVKVLFLEELAAEPDVTMAELFTFLEVDPSFECNTDRIYNASGRPRSRIVGSFFARSNPLKTAIKSIVPEHVRTPIRMAILDANSARHEEMTLEERNHMEHLFSGDVQELGKLLGRSIPWAEWC